jgi:hypothetical protein
MKTSNKLLIAFASALILVPLLGMIYVSRVNYKVGKFEDIAERKIENFSTTTKNMTSIAETTFQSINIADAKEQQFTIRFIKDDKFGIKIPTGYKDLVTASVDANGQLQFVVKAKPGEDRREYIEIFVYAPNLKEVNVSNASGAYIIASIDSLQFNVKNTGSASTGSGSHINHLTINTTNVGEVNFREDDIKSLTLNLNNTRFRSETNSYDNLSIATTGACDIEIRGNYDRENSFLIKNLALNTVGKADVKIENIKVNNCAGSFSDETTVQMPAVNLNQMYKK